MPYYENRDFVIYDGTDATKELDLDTSVIPTGTRRTMKPPGANGTLALTDGAQTFTALQTFKDTTFKIVDDADASKTLVFSLGGASANADLTLAWAGTADRTVTIPEMGANFTLAGLLAQTFTERQTITSTSECLWLTPNAATAAIVANIDTGSSGVVMDINDASIGFSTSILANSGLVGNITVTMPAGSGNLTTSSSTDTFNNKTMGVTTVLRTDSVSSGTHLRDVNTSTKRVYPILSGLSAHSSSLTFATTAARDWEFKNCAGTVVIVGNEAAAPSTDNLGKVDRTAITAVTAATNLTSATAVVGVYVIEYEMTCTTGTVADGTLTLDIIATGDGGAQTVSSAALPLSTATISATNPVRGSIVRYVASGALQYSTTVTGAYTAATTRTALRVRVMFLG